MKKSAITAILLLAVFVVTLASAPFAAAAQSDRYESFLEEGGLYGKIVKYFRLEQRAIGISPPGAKEVLLLSLLDLVLSLGCLWLALFILTGAKILPVKKYFWFVVALNLCWFVLLFFFKGGWGLLNFLVLRLRPELKSALVDFFSVTMVITAILVYIWLLARTFSLGLAGAMGVFFVSHAFYFLILLSFSLVTPGDSAFCELVNDHLGLGSVVRSYLFDLAKITRQEGILSLARFRPFHL